MQHRQIFRNLFSVTFEGVRVDGKVRLCSTTGPQDHKDSTSDFQVYWCHVKLLAVYWRNFLISLSLALGLRPTNIIL
jgi:hypothetical protein